jgi:histone deacetylase complex subunit SAP18
MGFNKLLLTVLFTIKLCSVKAVKMEIDRSKVCPLLLRCFWRMNRGNPLSDYRQTTKGIFPNQEVQIYTWQDATLKEICELIKDVVPAAREKSATLNFSLVCLNHDGNHSIKQVLTSL